MNFREYILTEGFDNLFIKDKMRRIEIADDIFDMLTKAYTPIGGLLTNGFQNAQTMIDKIPFWKVAKVKGNIVAVIMYKDKGGRKSVAAATDGTSVGKSKLAEMLKQEFTRSFGEKSGPILGFVKKLYPDLVKKFAIPADQVEKLTGAKPGTIELIKGEKFEFIHILKGQRIQKMLLGTPGKTIINY